MNAIEFQFYALSEAPAFAPDIRGCARTVYRKGDVMKSGGTRKYHAISYKQCNINRSDIEKVIAEFIEDNDDLMTNLVAQLSSHGEAFVRIEILAAFDKQICDFNLSKDVLQKIVDSGLSLDLVLIEPILNEKDKM